MLIEFDSVLSNNVKHVLVEMQNSTNQISAIRWHYIEMKNCNNDTFNLTTMLDIVSNYMTPELEGAIAHTLITLVNM